MFNNWVVIATVRHHDKTSGERDGLESDSRQILVVSLLLLKWLYYRLDTCPDITIQALAIAIGIYVTRALDSDWSAKNVDLLGCDNAYVRLGLGTRHRPQAGGAY